MTERALQVMKTDREEGASQAWRMLWRRIIRNRSIVLGAVVLIIIALASIFAHVISDYDPLKMNPRERLQPPSATYLFGTDDFGTDIFTRVLYGGRVSLRIGILAVAIAASIGTVLGLVAGFQGGWVDAVIMRLIDVMLTFPGILLAMAIVAVLGKSLTNVMIAVGISTVPIYARVVRASTLAIKELDYITSARSLGASNTRILALHVFPNLMAPLIVVTTNGVASAIISAAALSFLGLGANNPRIAEWGAMLNAGRTYLRTATWLMNFPGLAIMVTVMSINLLGDGLRDVLDPRLKTS
jgi:peptide/nickel transport system permease protein